VSDPLNPATWNRFSYVAGNPVNNTDSTGHSFETIADVIGLGADFLACADGDLLACGFLPFDVVAAALPGLPAPGAARLADEASDARRTAVLVGGTYTGERAGTLLHENKSLRQIHELAQNYPKVVVVDIQGAEYTKMYFEMAFPDVSNVMFRTGDAAALHKGLPGLSAEELSSAHIFAVGPNYVGAAPSLHAALDVMVPNVLSDQNTIWIATNFSSVGKNSAVRFREMGFLVKEKAFGASGIRVGPHQVLLNSDYFTQPDFTQPDNLLLTITLR
jgi:hypothetical protein